MNIPWGPTKIVVPTIVLLMIAMMAGAILCLQPGRPKSVPACLGRCPPVPNSENSRSQHQSARIEVTSIEISQQADNVNVTLNVINHADEGLFLSWFELKGILQTNYGITFKDARGIIWLVCSDNRSRDVIISPPPIDRDYVYMLPRGSPTKVVVHLGAGTRFCRSDGSDTPTSTNGEFHVMWTLSALDERTRHGLDVTAAGSGVWTAEWLDHP